MAQAAQPNFQNISNHLVAASNEIQLIPNMPAVQLAAQQAQQHAAVLAAIAQINAQFNMHFNNIDARFNNIDASLNQLNARLDHLPMQLHNATASFDAPLSYPQGTQMGPAFPETKFVMLRLSVANCNAVALALGLPPLPPNATVINRRQQIMDFLGCAIVAQ